MAICPLEQHEFSEHENAWEIDGCQIFEWRDADNKEGEKFGHDTNSDTYFYERWFLEGSTNTVIKSWLCRPREWGTIIKYYDDHEEHTYWDLGELNKKYEEFTKDAKKVKGLRSGIRNGEFDPESFTETFVERNNKVITEGKWVRSKLRGKYSKEETKEKKTGTDLEWGTDYEQQKVWKSSGEDVKSWTILGKKPDSSWREVVEQVPDRIFSDKSWIEGGKNWGVCFEETPMANWKLKWDGKQPKLGASRDVDSLYQTYLRLKATVAKSCSSEDMSTIHDPDENEYDEIV